MENKFYTQVQVQDPCHQPWSEMTPEQQGRFCNACSLTVIDFTNCTDEELFAFFSVDRKDRVCGRFRPEQLDRPLNVTRTRWGWLRGLAALILPLFIHSKADAQQLNPPAQKQQRDTGKVRIQRRSPILGIAISNRIQPEDNRNNPASDVDPRAKNSGRKEGESNAPAEKRKG